MNILIINASPKRDGHTYQLLQFALDTLSGIEGCTATYYSTADLLGISPHESHGFDDFIDLWEKSDGIILGSPVYTYGPPSHVYELFNLLQSRKFKNNKIPLKPIGIIAQGGGSYSGAEITAQVLMNLCISVGCTPVSGDMPGASQGFIGQITDSAKVSAEQLECISRLSIRVLEMVQILAAGIEAQKQPLHILGVVLGSNADDNSNDFLGSVFRIMNESYPIDLVTEKFEFSSKIIEPCYGCTKYCSSDLECVYHDAMQDFRQHWLSADALLWVVNNNMKSIPANLVAVIDRMNQVRFEIHFALKQQHMPRYLKTTALLPLGQTEDYISPTIQFLRHTAVLYQNILLPLSAYDDGFITLEQANDITGHHSSLKTFCKYFLERSIEVVSGLRVLQDKLPGEYYPSRHDYARLQLDA